MQEFSYHQSSSSHLHLVGKKKSSQAVPVKEWPLVLSDEGVLAMCPACGVRLKVKNIGQAWASARSHNEERHEEAS